MRFLLPVFLENFRQKLSVSTSCDLGDMVERVLTVMGTPLGSRDVLPPFFHDNLHVLMMFYSSPSPCNILLSVMCTYQLKPRSPPPRIKVGICGNFFMVFEGMADPWGGGISHNLLCILIEVGERGGDLSRA